MLTNNKLAKVMRMARAQRVGFDSDSPTSLSKNTNPLERLNTTPTNNSTINIFKPTDVPPVIICMPQSQLSFDFNWKLTLFALALFPLLIFLGLWQLDRAEQKRDIQQKWADLQAQPAVKLESHMLADDYTSLRRVEASGKYLEEKYWLKENQIVNGQLGYHVIMPFLLETGELVAVDRGWVLGSPLRDYVPEIQTPQGQLLLTGSLVKPSDSMLVREVERSAKTWPHKILEIDIPILSKQLGQRMSLKVLRLDADSVSAFEVHWRPINMSPTKHIGYAVQWFIMALALVILYIFASTNMAELLKRKRT